MNLYTIKNTNIFILLNAWLNIYTPPSQYKVFVFILVICTLNIDKHRKLIYATYVDILKKTLYKLKKEICELKQNIILTHIILTRFSFMFVGITCFIRERGNMIYEFEEGERELEKV